MIGSLGQPILFLVALGFGFGPIFAKAGQGNYMNFLAPGVIVMSILFTAMFNGIEVIWDRQFGFLKETLVSPASRFKIFLGRTLGGATVATLQGVVVLLITLVIGFRPTSLAYLPVAFIFMFFVAVLFTSLGTAIAARMEDMQAFPLITNFLVMPLFFLSGSLFPLNDLSSTLLIITRINPLTYGVDAVRGALTGAFTLGLGLDFVVMAAVTAVIFAIGIYMFSKIEL